MNIFSNFTFPQTFKRYIPTLGNNNTDHKQNLSFAINYLRIFAIMKNRNQQHHDNWATPPDFYKQLNAEFHFDFDPCPYCTDNTPLVDGLTIEWGWRNYVNPPYSSKGKIAFVNKALEESCKGKLCVLLLPVSTSTPLFHDTILPHATEIRFIRKRLKFSGINSKGQYVNWHEGMPPAPPDVQHVAFSGMHDSMLVVFGDRTTAGLL